MTRRDWLVFAGTVTLFLVAMVVLIGPPHALADTSATCTTDTATSYCEQVASGTGSSSFLSGFGIAELGGATLFCFLLSFHMVKRLLRAAGL